MKANKLQLEEDNILKVEIFTSDGKSTGEFLTFDLEDVDLMLRLQDMQEADKKNRQRFNKQLFIINKRQDVKGKKLLSKNEEDKLKALDEFLNKEVEIYNMFLGENGVQKLLNGRALGWTSLKKIDKYIEEKLLPLLNAKMDDITKDVENIIKKYGSLDGDKTIK